MKPIKKTPQCKTDKHGTTADCMPIVSSYPDSDHHRRQVICTLSFTA